MKDEEMAEQFADNINGLELTCSLLAAKDKSHAYRLGRYEGFLAGLKAVRPQWHYPSKGEYPKEYKDILICFLTEDDMKDCVRGWYEYDFDNDKHIFKYLNVLGTQYLETVIAWKEIVLPELKESE